MFFLSSKITSAMLLAGAALLFAMLAPVTSSAAVSATCQVDLKKAKMKVIAASNLVSTTSTLDVAIPNMTGSFVQGAAGCVVVQFFADTVAAVGETVEIQLDVFTPPASPVSTPPTSPVGAGVLLPGTVHFTGRGAANTDLIANSATFIVTGVGIGPKTFRMLWRSTNGGQVNFISRSVVVYYYP